MRQNVPIVGIGASAGGLEALEEFFKHVPERSGFAFVVVQHLDPTKVDLLPSLIQVITPMPVKQASNSETIQRNQIYIIPPDKDIALQGDTLILTQPTMPRGQRLPINFFFESLARELKEKSIAVVLSGMGSDGCLGIKFIKENAGLVLAQTPADARFDSMPSSAINSGLVDIVAPAAELANRMIFHLAHSNGKNEAVSVSAVGSKDDLDQIVGLIREHTGNDFSLYKNNTIHRRIDRRLAIHSISTLDLYVKYLRENSQEIDILFKELLIGVTSFFRDVAVWEELEQVVLPDIFARFPKGKQLRAWVTPCSTGQEAYTLAIVFQQAINRLNLHEKFSLKIFATDLDTDAIRLARKGDFSASIAAELPESILASYFSKTVTGYSINSDIRDMVVFAEQNILMDPPFTRLDILCCRNLLIYLGSELQRKLVPLFHYALTDEGHLVLGKAETIGPYGHLFQDLGKNNHIFKAINNQISYVELDFPSRLTVSNPLDKKESEKTSDMTKSDSNFQAMADQLLLRQYSPAAVIINQEGDILYVNGRTGAYLEPAAGKANWNIHAMIHDDISHDLELAIAKVKNTFDVRTVTCQVRKPSSVVSNVRLTVQRIENPKSLSGLIMVVFDTVESESKSRFKLGGKSQTNLSAQLKQSRDMLQMLREESQSTQEDLRSSIEELQSTNEELQSSNEELTTSKEEMQSLNEELQTVNSELESKISELSWVNNDMINLLNSTEIATLFLDPALNIRRFTSYCAPIFKLLPTDTGRPLSDIVTDLEYPSLQADARAVLKTLVFSEKEIKTKTGYWYKVRIMPYRTKEDLIDGVVITLADINAYKKLETELRALGR